MSQAIILFLALLSTFGVILIIPPNTINYYLNRLETKNVIIMFLYSVIASALWALLFYLMH